MSTQTTTPEGNTRNGEDGTTVDRADAALLRHFSHEQEMKDVENATGLTVPTAYRRLQDLITMGAIGKNGNSYVTTSLGHRLLADDESPLAAERILRKRLPVLSILPSLLHRAVFLLMLFAFIAKRDALVEEGHPSTILLGKTQRLKSWLVKMLCYAVGVDPEKARLSMPQVRRRGLLGRLGAKGELVYENEVLEQPLIWGDELSIAESEVKRDVETLVEGRTVLKIENQELPIKGTVIFELNARKEGGTLEEQTGLRAQRLRRCIVANFNNVNLNARVRARSAQTLAEHRAQAPLDIPKAPHEELTQHAAELVVQALDLCTLPNRIDYLDAARVIVLIRGAKALLDERSATAEVLFRYFAVAESCGHLKPNWRADLAELLYPPPPSTAIVRPAPTHDSIHSPVPPDRRSEPMSPNQENHFRLDQNLMALKALMDSYHLRIPEDILCIDAMLRLYLCGDRQNGLLIHFQSEVSGNTVSTRRTLFDAPVDYQDVRHAIYLYRKLASAGLSFEQAETILDAAIENRSANQ